MATTRFDTVTFFDGPLAGVCWPCILDPQQIVVRTTAGCHCYECAQVEDYEDGRKNYRMALTRNPKAFWGEFWEG